MYQLIGENNKKIIYFLNLFQMADNLHIGKVIKSLVEKSEFNSSDIAKKLGISYQNLYKIYSKESVETRYLFEISEILNVHISAFFNLPQKGWVSELEAKKMIKEISSLQTRLKQVEEQLADKRQILQFIEDKKLLSEKAVILEAITQRGLVLTEAEYKAVQSEDPSPERTAGFEKIKLLNRFLDKKAKKQKEE